MITNLKSSNHYKVVTELYLEIIIFKQKKILKKNRNQFFFTRSENRSENHIDTHTYYIHTPQLK